MSKMADEGATQHASGAARNNENSSVSPSQHIHNRNGRLHRLFHPSGKVFHIVRTHYEIEQKRHEVLKETPKPEDFEIVVHGSDEHIGAVRDCHAHQTKSRNALYTNNEDLLSRYDTVKSELDALSKELTSLTDHAVSLDASFDKFGYSALIRTQGDDETASTNSSEPHDVSKHQDRTLTAMKFFKAPVVRQYFHKGLIWRSPQAGEIVSFELFVDLVYVAVIDAIGEVAVQNASAASFLHYIIVFSIASKVFNDILAVMNWFEINDIFSRLCIMFIVICLYAFASNTEFFFETTYTAGLSFYLASRFFISIWFCISAYLIPMVRPVLIYQAAITLLAALFWIGSIHVEYPRNLGLIFVAIFIDFVCGHLYVPLVHFLANTNKKSRFLQGLVEYLPAMNIEHRVERTGAFVSLVIGYSVIKIFYQSRSSYPLDSFLGKGILGLIQAFVFNWIYFEIDSWGIYVHAIRRHWLSAGVWNLAHVPFSAAFILAASTLSELVIAHDCPDTDPETLADTFAIASIDSIDAALRWFYCGGLGVSLITMAVISLCHRHRQLPNAKLRKPYRLLYRIAIAITIICLPLAHHLTSLDLITITTCLVASVLMLDIFGNVCPGDGFFSGAFCKDRKRQTQYTAQCRLSNRRKAAMRERVARGEKVELDEVLARDGSTTSLESTVTRVGNLDYGAGSY